MNKIMQDLRYKEIVEETNSWLGTPYLHQNSLKGCGCDCLGLVRGIAVALNYLAPDFHKDHPEIFGYGRSPYGLLVPLFQSFCNEIPLEDMGIGHILIFRVETEPQHCGILTGDNLFIHAHSAAPKVCSNSLTSGRNFWGDRITNVFQFPIGVS
jgi:NlpC/P60 family putative phage cell wall peptidase